MRVTTERRGLEGGVVESAAGPWRTSGSGGSGSARKRTAAGDAGATAVADCRSRRPACRSRRRRCRRGTATSGTSRCATAPSTASTATARASGGSWTGFSIEQRQLQRSSGQQCHACRHRPLSAATVTVSMYVELHTASAFSFLDGASLPEALVDRAAELGYPALALLDRDGVYGAPRFHKAAKAAGIRAIVGAELTIDSRQQAAGSRQRDAGSAPAGALSRGRVSGQRDTGRCQLPAGRFPSSSSPAEGYQNLCRLITRMKLRVAEGRGGAGARRTRRPHRRPRRARRPRGAARRPARRRRPARSAGRPVRPRRTSTSSCSGTSCATRKPTTRRCVDLAAAFRVPVVATNGVRFATPAERPLFDVLTCIRHKTTLDAAGRRLALNAERYLKPPAQMAALFRDLPGGGRRHARRSPIACSYTMADLGYRFPDYPVPPGETLASFLRKITEVGARERYRPYHDRARAQIARELDLIEKLDLAGYFLIVWDIVNFCRQQDILVQGRGSAANSAVCYSLGHHGGRSGRHGPALRALPVGGARRVARHRSRPAERRSARARHPARLREVRPARRGDDGQRHHLPRPQRGARGGEGARPRRRRRSTGSRR